MGCSGFPEPKPLGFSRSLRPHFCVCHRTTALSHGITTQVISGQVLCH